MIVHGRRNGRIMVSKSYAEGMDKAYSEHLEPAREKDTKRFNLGDGLWIYSLLTTRKIQLSGKKLFQNFEPGK